MTATGIDLVSECFRNVDYTAPATSDIVLLVVVLCGMFAIFFIERAYPDFALLIPAAALAVVVLGNLVLRVFLHNSEADMIAKKYIFDSKSFKERRIWDIVGAFSGCSFYFSCIVANLTAIFSMAMLNLIYININLAPYLLVTNKTADTNKEWRTQGIANIFTAFAGFPSYIVCSTSVFFFKTGAKTRIASLLGTLNPIILALIAPYITSAIPMFLSHIILGYVGLSFIYSYYISSLKIMSRTDLTILTAAVVICKMIDVVTGFLFATGAVAVVALNHYLKELTRSEEKAGMAGDYDREQGVSILRVNYILCFITLQRFQQDLNACKGTELTLDLSRCPYIDTNANMLLLDYSRKFERVRIIGLSENFYEKMFRKQNNMHFTGTFY